MKKCDQDGSRLPQHSVERPWGILSPVYHLFTITSDFTLPEADTDKWRLCKPGRFSYGESPRTSPLEGTSFALTKQ